MNYLVLVKLLLLSLIVFVSVSRKRETPNFRRVLMGLCIALLATCVVQWLREGVGISVLVIAAIALGCLAFGFLRRRPYS